MKIKAEVIAKDLREKMRIIQYEIELGNSMYVSDMKRLWNDLSDIVSKVDALTEPSNVTEEEINQAAKEWEIGASAGAAGDYVNEDFIAGVRWMGSQPIGFEHLPNDVQESSVASDHIVCKSQKRVTEFNLEPFLKKYKTTILGTMSEHEAIHSIVDFVQSQQQESAQELMNDIAEWSDSEFGTVIRNPAILFHLRKEVPELIKAIQEYQKENSVTHITKSNKLLSNVMFEFADCYMLLMDSLWHMGISFDSLLKTTRDKLEINKKRDWGEPDENGVVEHIKD